MRSAVWGTRVIPKEGHSKLSAPLDWISKWEFFYSVESPETLLRTLIRLIIAPRVFLGTIGCFSLRSMLRASLGHEETQSPQPMQRPSSTTAI